MSVTYIRIVRPSKEYYTYFMVRDRLDLSGQIDRWAAIHIFRLSFLAA